MSYSRQAGTGAWSDTAVSIAPHVWFCGQADRLIQYQDVGFSYLYRHGLLLETRPNGVWSLVLGADHEATRSQLLLAGTTFASLTVVRAQQPGRLCQIGIVMLYPEKDRRATSFYRLPATA